MKAHLLTALLAIGSLALVGTLGFTSASCGDKSDEDYPHEEDSDDTDTDTDTDETEDGVPVECIDEPRTDCPSRADLEPAARADVFPDVEPGGTLWTTSTWGWTSDLIDFTCCEVTSATVSGTADGSFSLGWSAFDADGDIVGGGLASVRGGEFTETITFTARHEMKGIYVSTGADSEAELDDFTVSITFAVSAL